MAKLHESKKAQKALNFAPKEILLSYEVWARLVESHGHIALKRFPGYKDEALKGQWSGYRSSRLNLKWRVIYYINHQSELEIINVEHVTAHDYRRK